MSGEDLIVAVLAGGEGRRMGGDKALRPLAGVPLVARAVALARREGAPVVVAVRDRAQVAGAVDAPLVLDDPAIGGPLAGLAAALAYARRQGARLLLTLPCDMPQLPADLGGRLVQALKPAHGAALAAADGRLYPVCGLWRVETALERLPAYLAEGSSSLWGFAELCGLAVADWGAEGAAAFANVNSPEDLQRLAKEAQQR